MKDKLIIFVTMSLWDEPHRGRHHFANLLADNNTIIWVNRHYSWRERNKRKKGLEHIDRGLYVLHNGLMALPGRIDNRLNINNSLRLRLLLATLKKNGFNQKPDVIWIYDYKAINFAAFGKDQLNSKVIYFCNDYFGDFAYSRYESKLCSKVDSVFCTAPKLRDRLIKYNQSCMFLPHGVWPPKKTIRFEKKSKPETIGYIGTLNATVNIDFFYKILDQTGYKLILGGPIVECGEAKKENFRKLLKCKRVSYLGNVEHVDLYDELEKIDICMIPYICDFRGQHQFAIKFFEYLSAGKPIVATPYFEWPEPYKKFVCIYDNNDNLKDFLYSVYSQWNKDMFDSAKRLASQSTWNHRIQEISEVISNDNSI